MNRLRWIIREFPLGWRFVLAFAALFCLNWMLREVAGFNVWVVLVITAAIGGWLGTLVAIADREERDERFFAAQAEWKKRFEQAYRKMGYRVMKGKGDDIQGS